MARTTLLIDGDILIYRASAAAETAVEWEPEQWSIQGDAAQAKQRVDAELAELKTTLEADDMLIALSCRERNFRKEILPTYKSKRGRKPCVFFDVRDYVTKTYKAQEFPGLEADDVLGMYSTGTKIKGKRIVVSQDKDLRTVPGFLYNPGHPENGVEFIHDKAADWNHLIQTLTGDNTDGYSGCPGIGKKRAEKLFGPLTLPEAWPAIVREFEKAGLTEEDALVQARVARILRNGEYNKQTGEVTLWQPQ